MASTQTLILKLTILVGAKRPSTAWAADFSRGRFQRRCSMDTRTKWRTSTPAWTLEKTIERGRRAEQDTNQQVAKGRTFSDVPRTAGNHHLGNPEPRV